MIGRIDHIVLTTANEAACIDFYIRGLGMRLETFVGSTPPLARKAFAFGKQKISLYVKGKEPGPKPHLPVPGSLDLRFLAAITLDAVKDRLARARWPVVEGSVLRTGATQQIRSVYVHDPDLNLVELSEPA